MGAVNGFCDANAGIVDRTMVGWFMLVALDAGWIAAGVAKTKPKLCCFNKGAVIEEEVVNDTSLAACTAGFGAAKVTETEEVACAGIGASTAAATTVSMGLIWSRSLSILATVHTRG